MQFCGCNLKYTALFNWKSIIMKIFLHFGCNLTMTVGDSLRQKFCFGISGTKTSMCRPIDGLYNTEFTHRNAEDTSRINPDTLIHMSLSLFFFLPK